MENTDRATSAPINSTPRSSTKRLKPAFTTRIAKGTANVSSTSIHGSVKGAGNMHGHYTPPRAAVNGHRTYQCICPDTSRTRPRHADSGLAHEGDVHYASGRRFTARSAPNSRNRRAQ